ncbi:MAG TPA: tRNA lysidine(34) synthetase TilS [Ignavibacteriaceae bacterium]
MERTEQKFLRFIDEHNLIAPGEKILAALSGGPDSVFLLYLLYKFRTRLKIRLSAIHINHSLRGKDAAGDEKFCSDYCRNMGIDFVSVKKNVKSFAKRNGYSLEEAGRILRYREFARTLKVQKLDKIATAHNANDNTETVLLNLIKGTGLDGISGIPAGRENIIRPILCFTKEEILSYLDRKNISFRIDKSNEDTNFERNYLRNKILPMIKTRLNPSVDQAVLVSSENFRSIKEYILSTEAESFKNIKKDTSGNLQIGIADLKKAIADLRGLLLKTLLERELDIQIFSRDIRKIFSLSGAQTGKQIELSGGTLVFKEREYLKFIHNYRIKEGYSIKIHAGEEKTTPFGTLSIRGCERASLVYSSNKNKEYISADALSNEFTIRRWKNGDSFHPLGMRGKKKISDFLNEQKVESSGKKDHLILLNDDKVVWVIGLRIDDRYKIIPTTQKILELWLK